MKKLIAAAVLCACAGSSSGADAPRPVADLAREARAAYDKGDKATFLKNYEEIARRRPGDVWILYNLACGQAINGQTEAAVATLRDIAAHRVAADIGADADLESLRKTAGYREVATAMEALHKQKIDSGATRAFTIPEKGFIPEGVAYDPVSRSFFVASIRHRRIVRIDRNGKIADFVSAGRDSLRSALGMRVDPKARTLWVASQALPSMDGYKKEDEPPAAVFAYDVDSGALRKQYLAPAGGEAPAFDDLTVAADGRVYVNDGAHARIWMIAAGGALEKFVESDTMGGTQGLALSPDGRTLYVSDYRALFAIDVATRQVSRLAVPSDLALNGIDGLVSFDHALIGIQNGIEPHRVIRLDLTADGAGIAGARILEMNHPDLDEPTLGVVVDGVLYFTADSQGQRFLDEKKPPKGEELKDAVILKLPLQGPPR